MSANQQMAKLIANAAEAARLDDLCAKLDVDAQTVLEWCAGPSEGARLLRRYLRTGLRGDQPDPPPDA